MDMENHSRPGWIMPSVLIMFILEVLLFPLAVGATYSGRSESPDHILTYTTGRLTWDSATGIDENGSAVLTLFNDAYNNVLSDNGERVVAPGTDGLNIIRLKNSVDRVISYKAVMYRIKDNDELPVETAFGGDGLTDTDEYPLPEGVDKSQVVRAVEGQLDGGEIQDFDISWLWKYYVDDAQDVADTALGDKAAFDTPDDITVGIYIVVEEDGEPDDPGKPLEPTDPDDPDDPDDPENPDEPEEPEGPKDGEGDPDEPEGPEDGMTSEGDGPQTDGGKEYIYPDVPKTGDSGVTGYAALMAISAAVLILFMADRRRDEKCEEDQ